MAELSEMESRLQELMPRGLGEQSQARLESVIDELVASTGVVDTENSVPFSVPFSKKSGRSKSGWPYGFAAALTLGVGGLLWFQGHDSGNSIAHGVVDLVPDLAAAEMTFLAQRTWLDGGEDLGIRVIDDFGEAQQGWSFAGVEEERMHHSATGYEVIVQREFEGEYYAATSF